MEKRMRRLGILFLFFYLCIGLRGRTVNASSIEATDLDLGNYQNEMTVGTSQLLTTTVLPITASNQEVFFSSNDKEIAEVNALGRITANKIGKVKITVKSGKVKKVIDLEVKEDETAEDQTIPVTAIEVDEFNDEMKVEEKQSITATVVPTTATDATISYRSSNPDVAKVSSAGKVTALKKGTTTIILSAGGITKKLKLSVNVLTKKIEVSTTYTVLDIGDSVNLKGTVYPKDAVQSLTYKTTNNDIVNVSREGRVTAKSSGSSSVIVSNGDLQTIVTIIVNEPKLVKKEESSELKKKATADGKINLLSTIKGSKDEKIYLKVDEVEKITNETFRYLYKNKKVLVLEGNQYQLMLNGNDIINFENEWNPSIVFKEEDDGISFTMNDGKNIPGIIYLTLLDDSNLKGKYVYLYNEGKDKYELLNTKIKQGEVKIDSAGKYMITEKKLSSFHCNFTAIGLSIICLIAGGVIYICVARKYWFW